MKKTLSIIIVSFFLILASVQVIKACESAPGDPWFSEKIKYYFMEIPEGGVLHNTKDGQTYLKNTSTQPLYIVKKETNLEVENLVDLPKGYRPLYKLEGGRVYYWNWDFQNSGWAPMQIYDVVGNAPIEEYLNLDDVVYSITDLSEKTKQIIADARPEGINVPNPVTIDTLIYFNQMEYTLKGLVSYSLNEKYNPTAGAEGLEFCANWSAGAGQGSIAQDKIPLTKDDIGNPSWWDSIVEFFANLF